MSVAKQPRITHVITGLALGGAEMMLYRLVAGPLEHVGQSRVVALGDEGPVGESLVAAGVEVETLRLSWCRPRGLLRLPEALLAGGPDLLQGWMYHGNLATLASSRRRSPPILWNIRQSFSGYHREKLGTAAVIRLGAAFSTRPARIIYNARASARQHEAIGYDPHRTVIIPNGFDLERFRPDQEARAALRASLGVAPETQLVGHVARYHPMKNHVGMLEVAARVTAREPGVAFVLCGTGVEVRNATLMALLQSRGLVGRVHLLGPVTDTPRLMAGLDLLCHPSAWGEGFPNVVGEALACCVPCVVTDVGDSRLVVGDAGTVVPPGDTAALSEAILDLLRRAPVERRALGEAGRRRIALEFSLAAVRNRYVELYQEVLDTPD